MKRFVGILTAALLLVLGAWAQDPQGSAWVSLFNGKDLSGWKKNGEEKWASSREPSFARVPPTNMDT